jgi:hypothetical protein
MRERVVTKIYIRRATPVFLMDEPFTSSTRSQSEVVGFALLVVITVLGISGIVLFGGDALRDVKSEARLESAQHSFTALDSEAAEVALGTAPVRTVDLHLSDGRATVRHTGRIKITTGNSTTLLNRTLGTITYSSGGSTLAYQGGGVWLHGGDRSRMVSPPELHYRGGTLTLPAILVRGTEDPVASDEIRLEKGPQLLNLGRGYVPDTAITLSVTSDFYEAWAGYFRDRVPGVSVDVHHSNRTVRVTLGREGIGGNFDRGIVASGDVTIDTPQGVTSEVLSSGTVDDDGPGPGSQLSCSGGRTGDDCITTGPISFEELDTRISRRVASAQASVPSADIDGGPTTLTAGVYYSDGFELDSGTLTFDLSGGNVTLFVSGNIGLANQRIQVVNGDSSNGVVKVYTLGDVAIAQGNAGVAVESDDASRFQIYGTSELHFGMGQTNTYGFTGVVYAPRTDPASGSNDAVSEYGLSSVSCSGVDICVGTGSGTVSGALIGGSVSIQQSATFEYDASLQSVTPSFPTAGGNVPPPLTYLHVSANVLNVSGLPVAGSPGAPITPPITSATTTPPPTTTAPPGTSSQTSTPGESPEIDDLDIDDGKCGPGQGNGHCVEWSVEDEDADLVNVTLYLEADDGSVLATDENAHAPTGAFSGERWFQKHSSADRVRIVAVDDEGNRKEETEPLS